MKKIDKISEIAPDDNREPKEKFLTETISAAGTVEKELKRGKRKLLAPKEFDEWCKKL